MTLKTLTLAFASSAALVLAACDSGDGDSDGSSTTNTTPPATQTDPMTTGPTSGDTTGPTSGDDTTGTPDDTTGTPDDTTTDDATTAGPALSFAVDVYPAIIGPSCSCHNSVGGTGGLAMGGDAASAYMALVGVPSSTGKNYVTAGDVGASYIHDKVSGTQSQGQQMPLGGMLTSDQIGIIDVWIAGGANP